MALTPRTRVSGSSVLILAVLSLYGFFPSSQSPITLDVFLENCYGLTVIVNGYVGTSKGTIQALHWEWGDGASRDSWFPASHTYAAPGTYTIRVTAFCSTGQTLSKTLSVDVGSGAGGCLAPPPPSAGVVLLSECTDPCGDFSIGYGDILAARICTDARGAEYTFWMFVREAVPAQPDVYTAYIWLLDTDMDAFTGLQLGEAGSDFHVRLAYAPGDGWKGFIDILWGGVPGIGPTGTVTVEGNSVQIVIPRSAFEQSAPPPPGHLFLWIATTIAADNGQGDRVPDYPAAVVARDPQPVLPRVSFDRASYTVGETVTITVFDERYTGAPAISGLGKVLVLTDTNGTEVASWTTIPALSGRASEFRVAFKLPPGVAEGSVTATYTDPAFHARRATAVSAINSQTQRFSPPYILFPPNLHLVPGETSAVPLRVLDKHGNTVTGTVLFSNFDTTLISIAQDGYVTALRAEGPTEIGTWVVAHANGILVESTCIVRVLSRNPGTEFIWVAGQNTALYYPATVRGEDIGQHVSRFEIVKTNEYAYQIQRDLMGVQPFNGARQVFAVDFGETEAQRVCGISGNPVRLGWNMLGNEWQNCFLVPHVPPRSPQWGVFYHELSHNFTWASSTFARALGEVPHYSEGIATALGLTTIARIVENQAAYPLSLPTVTSLQDLLERDERFFLDELARWLARGAPFGEVNANIVDGIWLEHRGQRPGDFAERFFHPLQPRYSAQVSPILSQMRPGDEHTLFAALVSAAAGSDLSAVFVSSYNYPINMPLFRAAYDVFTAIMGG